MASLTDDTLLGYRIFFSTVTYPADGTQGAFTDAMACKMSQRNKWDSDNKMEHPMVVLKFKAFNTQAQPTTMFLFKMSTSMAIEQMINIGDTISSKQDLIWTPFNDQTASSLGDMKLFYIDSGSTTFKINTI